MGDLYGGGSGIPAAQVKRQLRAQGVLAITEDIASFAGYSGPRRVLVARSQTINADLTLPSNLILQPAEGAVIKLRNGAVLTLTEPARADDLAEWLDIGGDYAETGDGTFTYSGEGRVVWPASQRVSATWYMPGATQTRADSTPDIGDAINALVWNLRAQATINNAQTYHSIVLRGRYTQQAPASFYNLQNVNVTPMHIDCDIATRYAPQAADQAFPAVELTHFRFGKWRGNWTITGDSAAAPQRAVQLARSDAAPASHSTTHDLGVFSLRGTFTHCPLILHQAELNNADGVSILNDAQNVAAEVAWIREDGPVTGASKYTLLDPGTTSYNAGSTAVNWWILSAAQDVYVDDVPQHPVVRVSSTNFQRIDTLYTASAATSVLVEAVPNKPLVTCSIRGIQGHERAGAKPQAGVVISLPEITSRIDSMDLEIIQQAIAPGGDGLRIVSANGANINDFRLETRNGASGKIRLIGESNLNWIDWTLEGAAHQGADLTAARRVAGIIRTANPDLILLPDDHRVTIIDTRALVIGDPMIVTPVEATSGHNTALMFGTGSIDGGQNKVIEVPGAGPDHYAARLDGHIVGLAVELDSEIVTGSIELRVQTVSQADAVVNRHTLTIDNTSGKVITEVLPKAVARRVLAGERVRVFMVPSNPILGANSMRAAVTVTQ